MSGPNIFIENLKNVTRRRFLKGFIYSLGAISLSGLGAFKYLKKQASKKYPGRIVGASSKTGHLIRQALQSTPSKVEKIETVIVGGGVSGLSTAWWFNKNDYKNFVLLELENQVGGNSQAGRNGISAYPWGAHYLPLPGPEAKLVRELLAEFGVIRGHDSKGDPVYNEYHLCADPHERLFIQGRWQEGIVPQLGLPTEGKKQYKEFFSLIEQYKMAIGSDGRRAFVIPVEFSSRDPKFTSLDKISMASFMKEKSWNSKYLNWYVNYCCRDDYGMNHDQVSAWAGIHYFASRIGKGSNADSQTVLTWPEGNGWLVNQLRETVSSKIETNTLVFSIDEKDGQVVVDCLDAETRKSKRIIAKKVVFAAPRFVGAHVIKRLQHHRPDYLGDLQYAPWVVANVSLRSLPGGNGAPLSWDNVSFYSESLGYVVATHQGLSLFPKKTVITYYRPLSDKQPAIARKEAINKTHEEWATLVSQDLARMHPGIEAQIENIDVMVWGHGMISPPVGFIWGKARAQMQASLGNIHFAHSDMSGISIFEEAQYHGVQAANHVLTELHHQHRKIS